MQSTAEVACRSMGFVTGAFQDAEPGSSKLPPWLSGIRCGNADIAINTCPTSEFGDTSTCGFTKRLVCVTSSEISCMSSRFLPFQHNGAQMEDREQHFLHQHAIIRLSCAGIIFHT